MVSTEATRNFCTDYGPAAVLCNKLAGVMAITALIGFWGYWCPFVQLEGLLGYLGVSTSPSPSPRQLQSLGLHYDRLHRPCQVWPHIRPWGPFIALFTASILDYLTGEYRDDCGRNISGLAAHPTPFAKYEFEPS